MVKDKIKERSRGKSPAFARRLKALKLRKAVQRDFKRSEVDFNFPSV